MNHICACTLYLAIVANLVIPFYRLAIPTENGDAEHWH